MSIEQKAIDMNITIPTPAKPLAAYVPFVVSGGFAYVSGNLPLEDGKLMMTGKLGREVSLSQGEACAKRCAINCLGALKAAAGSLDNIEQIVKITVFVNSAPGFVDQALVANGASVLLSELFGEAGKHARSAVGVAELPMNAPVEVEVIAKLK